MEQRTKLSNPFQIGLLGGLGVLVAIVLGGAIQQIATILTYVGISLFLALGLDPLISALRKANVPRPLAVAIVVTGFLGAVALLVWAILPTAVSEAGKLIERIPAIAETLVKTDLVARLDDQLGGTVTAAADSAITFITNSENWPALAGGLLQVGIGILSGVVGFVIVVILTLYFMASLEPMKDYLANLVSASKRERFRKITDQVALSVGRWLMGQTSIALIHAIALFIFLTIMRVPFALLLSLVAFLLALIPLVGATASAILVTSVSFVSGTQTAIVVGIYYLIYLQLEAYLVSPRVMRRAVSVPGALVVIAALVGGTLVGVLGALIAIPVAASVLLIVREVWIPKQQLR